MKSSYVFSDKQWYLQWNFQNEVIILMVHMHRSKHIPDIYCKHSEVREPWICGRHEFPHKAIIRLTSDLVNVFTVWLPWLINFLTRSHEYQLERFANWSFEVKTGGPYRFWPARGTMYLRYPSVTQRRIHPRLNTGFLFPGLIFGHILILMPFICKRAHKNFEQRTS